MKKVFESDCWGLINILRAADIRIGIRHLPKLKKKSAIKQLYPFSDEVSCLKINSLLFYNPLIFKDFQTYFATFQLPVKLENRERNAQETTKNTDYLKKKRKAPDSTELR